MCFLGQNSILFLFRTLVTKGMPFVVLEWQANQQWTAGSQSLCKCKGNPLHQRITAVSLKEKKEREEEEEEENSRNKDW